MMHNRDWVGWGGLRHRATEGGGWCWGCGWGGGALKMLQVLGITRLNHSRL